LVAIPPSSHHALAGATVICNPSASTETIDKAAFRAERVRSQSAATCTAYLYACAGEGESTTDLVFAGHGILCENGLTLAEQAPFSESNGLLIADIDVKKLAHERRRKNAFSTKYTEKYREIPFSLPVSETNLTRFIDPHPFVPADPSERARRCETVLSIQTAGLKQRIERAFAKKIVVGISGGLDSTLALLVMVRAMDALKRPRTDIIAVTMPCFGTTQRTKNNATVLCEELGVDFRTVDIFDAVNVHFRDIGHDSADRNVTYENSQARERTQILMDIANDCGGMVIGTGDLSELALGWATYNGDHMSMYGVNASVPKTLIRHVVAYYADAAEADGKLAIASALRDVLDTPVSPELLPADEDGNIAQKTEDLVGPYELHDFYLYYFLRFGYTPKKLFRIAKHALGESYSDAVLLKWLETFLRRFFTQQFKRSCLPDGPKVGSVGLSPRGDWKMPSDASYAAWLAEVEDLKNS
jgi:NAD+ synthase (glutamine-hydrolysing)